MEGNVTGTFLVRKSKSHFGNYFLSVRSSNNVQHYLIRKVDTRGFYISPQQQFVILNEIIQHYSRDADGLCTRLTVPCLKQMPDAWEIERKFIKLKDKLDDGEFSEVWAGTWNDTPVAVKTLKPGSMAVSDFFAEAQIMKKLQHDKLIKLYGVCVQQEPFYIVTELMKHGNLSDYLSKGEGQHLKFPELIDIAAQVANGMAYLESQYFVHRNLCASNVLVEQRIQNIVKIGDFSLARPLVYGTYTARISERTLVRWMAPEAMRHHHFTIKSDVWSFGVFLTELVTYGHNPYPGMTNDEVLVQVKRGYHMPQPPGCPDPLYQIMLQCWKTDPKERPTFEHLKDRVAAEEGKCAALVL